MIWESVKNSPIVRLGYDPITKQLIVIWCTGRIYVYERVDWDTWEALRTGESVGQIINRMMMENRRGL